MEMWIANGRADKKWSSYEGILERIRFSQLMGPYQHGGASFSMIFNYYFVFVWAFI